MALAPLAPAAPQSAALGAAQALGGAQPVAPVAAPAARVGVGTGELVQMATGALEGAAQPWLCWDAVTDVGSQCRALQVDDACGYSQESSGTIP